MMTVHEKIQNLLTEQGLSVRAGAERCGIKYRTLHNALTEKAKISTDMLQDLCDGLGVNFGYFDARRPVAKFEPCTSPQAIVNEAMQALADRYDRKIETIGRNVDTRITLTSFLNWWASHAGRLENFDQIKERVDMFVPPDENDAVIRPVRTGATSLATQHFRVESADHLRSTVDGFSAICNRKLVEAHREALVRGEPVITHPMLDEPLPDGTRFRRQYRRVMAPVYLPDRTPMLVNFSEDIV